MYIHWTHSPNLYTFVSCACVCVFFNFFFGTHFVSFTPSNTPELINSCSFRTKNCKMFHSLTLSFQRVSLIFSPFTYLYFFHFYWDTHMHIFIISFSPSLHPFALVSCLKKNEHISNTEGINIVNFRWIAKLVFWGNGLDIVIVVDDVDDVKWQICAMLGIQKAARSLHSFTMSIKNSML